MGIGIKRLQEGRESSLNIEYSRQWRFMAKRVGSKGHGWKIIPRGDIGDGGFLLN